MSERVAGVLGTGVLDSASAAVFADDVGLTRGDGCFEATRVLTDAAGAHRIVHLDAHLDRFDRSCAGLDLPPVDRPAWCALIDDLLARWTAPGEAMLRLMLSRGREWRSDGGVSGVATLVPVAAETLRQRREGIRVVTLNRGMAANAFTAAPWLLGGVKTLSYGINMAALREAARRDADDVLFLSSDAFVLEAPTATVVWSAGGQLHTTPTGGTGILASITQQALFDAAEKAGLPTTSTLGTVAELRAADGVWLVSSGRGVAAVRSLNGNPLTVSDGLTAELGALAGF